MLPGWLPNSSNHNNLVQTNCYDLTVSKLYINFLHADLMMIKLYSFSSLYSFSTLQGFLEMQGKVGDGFIVV